MVNQEIYTSLIVCPCKLLLLVLRYKAHFFVKKYITPREKKVKKLHLKTAELLNAQSTFSYFMPMEYQWLGYVPKMMKIRDLASCLHIQNLNLQKVSLHHNI